MHLQSSSEFLEFLKSAGKGFNHPGHVSHSEGIRRGLSLWLSGHVARSECIRREVLGLGTRDTWHTRNASGGIFSRREAFGTRGELGRHPEGGSWGGFLGHVVSSGGSRGKFSRLELSGRVAYPERSRGGLPAGVTRSGRFIRLGTGGPLDRRSTTGMDLLVRTSRSSGRRWPSNLGSTAGTCFGFFFTER